jgi:hypothetical protein
VFAANVDIQGLAGASLAIYLLHLCAGYYCVHCVLWAADRRAAPALIALCVAGNIDTTGVTPDARAT